MKKQTLLVLIYCLAPLVYVALIDGPGHGVSIMSWIATFITYAIATYHLGAQS